MLLLVFHERHFCIVRCLRRATIMRKCKHIANFCRI